MESKDERDLSFPMRTLLPFTTDKKFKYWNPSGWWGDQGNYPHCVGYAWAHFIDDGPIVHKKEGAEIDPVLIYTEAQKIDEWEGENYAGTSVRAGAKVLQGMGHIGMYTWAFDLETLVNAVLTTSPVVVGTNWYRGMFYPNGEGIIKPNGQLDGGHAYLINGVNVNKAMFRIKNSWSKKWGKKGHAYISFDDFDKLLQQDGEACLAFEIKK